MEKQLTPHYKEFLEREFHSRSRKNPQYSLRAFARDLEMSPSKLSEVLRGIRSISVKMAQKIATKIRLTPQEEQFFLQLVGYYQKKNRALQKDAEKQLHDLTSSLEYGALSLERFKIISDWHHFAILELTEIVGFKSDAVWISERLGLSLEKTEQAIERLIDFGLLKQLESGELKQTRRNLATPTGVPSRDIREHHSQILKKADQALDDVPVSERDFSATTLAFSSAQFEEVQAEIKDLRRKLGQKIIDFPNKDRVYCLAIQFFPIDLQNKNVTKESL